jgi:hypothetical protein
LFFKSFGKYYLLESLNFRVTMIISLLACQLAVQGQTISNTQWFFGQSSANLQFDKNGFNVYEEERMNANFGIGGPGVASNPFTGNLLFYTDGVNVYDASHSTIPGGNNLNGNPDINQSAIITPHPASNSQYFVITNSGSNGVNEIQTGLINASAVGNGTIEAPLGEMISSGNSIGLTNPSEGMIVIKAQAPNLFWLITQDRLSYDFRVTRINNAGFMETQVFALDTATAIPGFEVSQFDYNEDSSLLAVAPKDPNRNILLLNFTDSSGVLTVNRQIRNTGFNDDAGENVYDVEWSPNGSKLLFTRFGTNAANVANVYQYDLGDSLNRITELLSSDLYRSYGLKKGIDNSIYHLYQTRLDSAIIIGRFSNTDSIATDIFHEPAYFTTNYNGRQFPSFSIPNLQNIFTMDFAYLDTCEGNTTKFFSKVDPVPNNYFWDFGDGNYSTGVAPLHQYQAAGNYTVRLAVELNGVIGSTTLPVNIRSNQNQVNLGNDTTICVDEILVLPLQEIENAIAYQWSTGENTSTIEIDTAGTYWLEATFSGGCTGFAAITVSEYGVTQNVANQWYFGEHAGLDFNETPPVALADGNQMFSAEGCATISDSDGNLVFYTNGNTVWNKDHEVMTVLDTVGGLYLGGDSTAVQGAMILPFMDDETMYYIFSAEEVYGDGNYDITYAIVDMKEDSAKGAVILKNLPLAENMVEKITATGFTTSSWLTLREFGNNNFRTHLVSDQGIGAVTHTPMGEVLYEQFPERAEGYMKYNVGTTFLVNAIPGPNQIEIIDFDFTLGRYSNARLIETNETDPLYGVELAGGGTKLYVTTANKLIQYDLDSLNTPNEITDITDSKFEGYNTTGTMGALQRGPNGVIYMAVDGASSVQSINSPNSDDAGATYDPTGIDLLGATSRLGLPNFTQQTGSPPTPASLSYINACLGQETQLFATGTSTMDEFFWTFDSTASFPTDYGDAVTTIYSSVGLKYVELNITNRCATDRPANDANPDLPALAPPFSIDTVLSDSVEVFAIPEQPIFPDETNLCAADSLLVELWFEDRSDLSFNWVYFDPRVAGIGALVRDTSRVLLIDETLVPEGTLRDFTGWIENSDGCRSDTLAFTSSNNRPFVDLGFDQSICQYTDAPDVNANVTGVTFDWWVNGLEVQNQDTAYLQAVNTSTAGILEYVVRIQEPFFGCTQTDTVLVTIQEAPLAVGNITPPTLCGALDAVVSFDISTSGSFQYNIAGDGLLDAGALNGPGTSLDYPGLGAGVYQLDLQNIVTGCTNSQPIIVEDDVPFDLTASNLPDCLEDANLQLTLGGVQLPEFVRIYITDMLGDTVFTELETTVPIQIYPALANGQYYATVIDRETGCLQADSVLIEPLYPDEDDCDPVIYAPTAFLQTEMDKMKSFSFIPMLLSTNSKFSFIPVGAN